MVVSTFGSAGTSGTMRGAVSGDATRKAREAGDVAEAAEIPDSLDTAEAVEFPWEACAGDACATLCAACPVPTLQATANGNAVTNGDSFKVQTEFAFQAVVDAGPCGAPVEWSWTLVGPAASADRLTPDSTGPPRRASATSRSGASSTR